jgi:GNAT superfamily N-acetyltransferase
MTLELLARAAAAALADDPFYATISAPCATGASARERVLHEYFACSIAEGEHIGRVVQQLQPTGVAVWTLPVEASVELEARRRKRAELARCLGLEGLRLYDAIVAFMGEATSPWVRPDGWYLSIAAVDPIAQNTGIGRRLLAPTLADADSAGAQCYLETFTPRSTTFYERLGFNTRAEIAEPTTRSAYAVMVRDPRAR